jgi:hypothetical protein
MMVVNQEGSANGRLNLASLHSWFPARCASRGSLASKWTLITAWSRPMLEAEWNTKLRELEEARAIEEQYNRSDQHQVSAQERAEIEAVEDTLSSVLE